MTIFVLVMWAVLFFLLGAGVGAAMMRRGMRKGAVLRPVVEAPRGECVLRCTSEQIRDPAEDDEWDDVVEDILADEPMQVRGD